MIDPQQIRKKFPQLADPEYHYLDSAATSLTPQSVLDAEIDYYTHARANVHRGVFAEAAEATTRYETARQKVAEFIHADAHEVVFTSGATESSNMLVRMLDESLHFPRSQKAIVTTIMEHHAALLPLQQFALRRDLRLLSIPLDPGPGGNGVGLDVTQGLALITEDVGLVALTLASNVTGAWNDITPLLEKARSVGAITVVDATAAAGHVSVDVRTLGCDALYFSGHKMFAPTGIGVLWVRMELLKQLTPSIFGGHMVSRIVEGKPEWSEIPSRFEAGTKNIAGAIGLAAAIDEIRAIGVDEIHTYVGTLVADLTERLTMIPGVKVISEHDPKRNVGIVSFVCDFAHPHDVAEVLSRDHVAVRPGHHCAIPLHGALGIESSVRASFHCYNTTADVVALCTALEKCRTIFS